VTPAQVRRAALALPEVVEAPHFDMASFRVRGKIFATLPADGRHLHVFVGEEARAQALALHGEAIEKLPWGAKIVGLRIDLARIDAAAVASLLRQAWMAKAPKDLVGPVGGV
jgi:hypothetical protein